MLPYFGMLALGAFVGSVSSQGVNFMKDAKSWKNVLTAIIGACFGGATVTFMSKMGFNKSEAIAMYPVGLLLGYTWIFAPKLAEKTKTGASKSNRFWGYLGFAGLVILTGAAIIVSAVAN
jgi:hypothetical protein